MSELVLGPLERTPPGERAVEVVERKGKGHPDAICDALAESLSAALVRYYHEHAGSVQHHNVDTVLLRAGAAEPRFGGGRVTEPMTVYLSGRAILELEGREVPVEELAREACRSWLDGNLHAVDPERHVRVECLVRPGSRDLVELFRRQREEDRRLANDTSCGVGYAPATDLERVVLAVERELTAVHTVERHPGLGEDVKVLGIRRGEGIDLTVACATVSAHAADEEAAGSVYLTVTGTSAEAGDDGQAGRGNRVGGLITPGRPMVLEPAAGKNPVTHTGKLYSVVAHRIAHALVEETDGIAAAECLLVSRIGEPVDLPPLVEVRIRTRDGSDPESHRPGIEALVEEHLEATGQPGPGPPEGEVLLF